MKRVLFRYDAETAHHFTLRVIALLGMSSITRGILRLLARGPKPGVEAIRGLQNLPFANRIGLAAGLDKNAEILSALPSFGFGFAEIGTVTPRPQEGNPRPRLFRKPEEELLFNRMGFNNLGADVIAKRLGDVRLSRALPNRFRVGVNLGKNKDTPAEEAASDYALAARPFRGLADYFVINVSSPNTPGLRSLQTVEALRPIIVSVRAEMREWMVKPPIFLKLAPELDEWTLEKIFRMGEEAGLAGFVLSNTLGGTHAGGPGGWSGKILTERSRELLAFARSRTTLAIISVGGILSVEEAKRRLEMGADLVQIYSGWIYRGPFFPAKVARSISSS